jgi:hypothetical protein
LAASLIVDDGCRWPEVRLFVLASCGVLARGADLSEGNMLSERGRVMKGSLLSAVASLVFFATLAQSPPAQAQIVGRFAVEGQNPNGTRYGGTASVERTGQTYRVSWVIDGARFIGTGIGSDQAIAITYRSGNQTGVALLGQDASGYGLVWTYAGGTGLGTERWTRR